MISFIFPGQGAQYVGMGKELAEHYKEADMVFEKANDILNIDLKSYCFNGPENLLKKTEITQPAILTTSIAFNEILKKENIKPQMVAGLSLGEYSALVAADSIDFETALPLVQKRGRYMQEAAPEGEGSMAAIIGLNKLEVSNVCNEASEVGFLSIANYNCPNQLVVAGETKAVEFAIQLAKNYGAKRTVMLPVSAPFHTIMLESAGERLSLDLDKIKIDEPKVPFLSNVNANYTNAPQEIKYQLTKQVYSPVLWENIVNKMISDGTKIFVEVGPGKALSSFVKKINRNISVLNIENIKNIEKLIHTIKEVAV